MAEYYPPVGFHFKVEFLDVGGLADKDVLFQEVSGLTAELEVESLKEGGENRFTHKLPTRATYQDVVLKRGLLVSSDLVKWMTDAIENLDIQTTSVIITLLNEEHQPLQAYQLYNAYPKKWSISNLNAQESQLVVETLELTYQYFKITSYGTGNS